MTPERWSQVQEKLEIAAALEVGQRSAYLADLGATDPAMREDLESLLSELSNTADFLKTSATVSYTHLTLPTNREV